MSNFKDFDLELKKVAGGERDIPDPSDLITWITEWITEQTLQGCKSADVPTGGATRPCCKKNNNVEPKCI